MTVTGAKLRVQWDDILVGTLNRIGRQEMSFQYSADYLASTAPRPISLSLPLQAAPFDNATSKAWFANLLPEGEVRGHVARKLGVSERNEFAMLEAIGGDCAGALTITPDGVPGDPGGRLLPLTWEELETRIATTPRPSLLALVLQDGEPRLSLAGAQDKLPVWWHGGRLALPVGETASTHLLKISSGGLADLVQNELFCLTLARAVGLDVPQATMAPTETPILLVPRYDRRIDAVGHARRLHQEDFCQALGFPPESKYENEGGPSLAQMFEALARGSQSPLPDKKRLLTWVLFNVLIGNADAHAKNASLVYGTMEDRGAGQLAPFYDLVGTAVYDQLSTKMAQKIGGEYRAGHVTRRHWERLSADIGVKASYLRGLGLELCGRVEGVAAKIAVEIGEAHGGQVTLTRLVEVIASRVRGLRGALGG